MIATPHALAPAALAQCLQGADLDWEIAPRIASTNAELARRARAAAPRRPILLAADEQTAGRGRQGRSWHAAPGHALLFSLAQPWARAPAASAAVTLACGVALARCLEQQGIAVRLKWPNDILLHGRKLAGLLTELTEDRDGARTLVVGVGMNLVVDAALRASIDQPVAELAECLGAQALAHKEAWLARCTLALLQATGEFAEHGFAPARDEFNRRCAYLDQAVLLTGTPPAGGAGAAAPAPLRGILRGVDEQGRLLLESDGRVLAMMSGDVSLRADAAPPPCPGESP